MTTRRQDVPSTSFSEDDSAPASNLSSMQRAIVTIQKLRGKVESLERARTEPIAIVGMACRFPGGANSPEALFRLLEEGVDAVTEVPPERWRLEQESADSQGEERSLRWGAFLKDVDLFDAEFFGISRREAESLDPQQRLLLEVAWEALERAGQLPERLMGSKTGVFVGIWSLDYQQRVLALNPDKLDAYCFTGNVLSTAAGRLAYTLGLHGPCMSVETACSSSLTAVHLACQSLRAGESSLALAGGVNLMLSPTTTKLLSKTQALSPDGRCKTFDARANGFVRGEGCGIVVLKRLSDAERDGDTILALIRGSAVNQDGRSTGLTAPNVLSQQALLRQALENARIAPQDIGYLETHGTGTSLGDPIEAEAIKSVLGAPRDKGATCVLGAVKTNIGHLEAAAGIAGLIKTVLVLQNERIPGNLHFRSLNPRIDLTGTSLEIAQSSKQWPPGVRARFAGVSSFGISGTNAHVIVEEAPRNLEEVLGEEEVSTCLLPLSAKTPEALHDEARAFREMLVSESSPRLVDIVYTASSRRTHYLHRLSVVGRTKEEMAAQLGTYLQGDAPAGVAQGKSTPARAKVVFVFSGQGSQWLGMGRELYLGDASFRSVIDTCDNLMTTRLGWSILDELEATEATSRMSETHVAQPLLFALQIALVEMLRSWGISPDAMIGHSVGEIAAAHTAGILSLDEAIRLVTLRGRIMQKATGMGKMVSVTMPAEEARKVIAGNEERLAIAAINDPTSVVLSGQAAAVDDAIARCEKLGFSARPLRVHYAFHSPQMDTLRRELVDRLVRVDTRRATLAMYSTVLGECVDGKELDARYWGQNVRETVNFAGAVFAAIRDGYQLFLEIGPHPVLTTNIQQCLAAKKCDGVAVYVMRRNQDQARTLLEATGALYTRGCSPEWSRTMPSGGKCVPIPTYPWQRERYWLQGREKSTIDSAADPIDQLLHEIEWRRKELRPPATAPLKPQGGTSFLIFEDAGGLGRALGAMLEAQGMQTKRVIAGQRYERLEPSVYSIDPADPKQYDRLLSECLQHGQPCNAVIHLWNLDATGWEQATLDSLQRDQKIGACSVLALTQAILRLDSRDIPKLWLITRGAQAKSENATILSPSAATSWGLARSLLLEHGELECMRVDLDPLSADKQAEQLVREICTSDGEDEVLLRDDGRFVARLVSTPGATPARSAALDENAEYIVVHDDAGRLTFEWATWLAKQGARHVTIRSDLSDSEAAQEQRKIMAAAGVEVAIVHPERDSMNIDARMFEGHSRAIRGVIWSWRSTEEARPFIEISLEQFEGELRACILDAFTTHQLTRSLPLDMFVLNASASSILGLVGRPGYAAANAFLEALAYCRRKASLPATCIQWGAIAGASNDDQTGRLAGAGMRPLTREQVLEAFGRLQRQSRTATAVMHLDVRQWLGVFPQLAARPFYGELRSGVVEKHAVAQKSTLKTTLTSVAPQDRLGLIEELVRQVVAEVVRTDIARVEATAPFRSLGVDSLMSLEVRNRLERELGLKLPATLLFTYAHTAGLAEFLLAEMRLEPAVDDERPGAAAAAIASDVAALDNVDDPELLALLDEELALARRRKST